MDGSLTGEERDDGGSSLVAKYDSDGNQQWLKQFGTANDDSREGVSSDATGIYVGGLTYGAFPGQTLTRPGLSDGFIAKYDTNGNQQLVRQFGTSGYDLAFDVASNSTAEYVAGAVSGTFPDETDSGGYDAFLVKLGPSDISLTETSSTYTGPLPQSLCPG